MKLYHVFMKHKCITDKPSLTLYGIHRHMSNTESQTLLKSLPRLDPEHPKDLRQRAKAGKSRLQQVCPDKGCEVEPVWAMNLRQQQTDQDKRPGKGYNQTIYCHNASFFHVLSCWLKIKSIKFNSLLTPIFTGVTVMEPITNL